MHDERIYYSNKRWKKDLNQKNIFSFLVFLLKEHKLVACLNHIFWLYEFVLESLFFLICRLLLLLLSAMNSILGIAWKRTLFCNGIPCTFEGGVAGFLPLCVGVAGFGGALALLGVTDPDRDCGLRIRAGGLGIYSTLSPPPKKKDGKQKRLNYVLCGNNLVHISQIICIHVSVNTIYITFKLNRSGPKNVLSESWI